MGASSYEYIHGTSIGKQLGVHTYVKKKKVIFAVCAVCLKQNGTIEFTFVPSCVIYALAFPANFLQIFSLIQWSCGELWGCLRCRMFMGNQTH